MKSRVDLVFAVLVLATCVEWSNSSFSYPAVKKCTDGETTCFITSVAYGGGAISCERQGYEIKG